MKPIVDTCDTCRHWARLSPQAIATHRLSIALNQRIQRDILFYKNWIASHMCDEATRFCAAVVINDKEATTTIQSIMSGWVRFSGPPQLIIADGESCLDSEGCRQWLGRIRGQMKTKDPGKHAQSHYSQCMCRMLCQLCRL